MFRRSAASRLSQMSALWSRYLKGGCDAVVFVFDVSARASSSTALDAAGKLEQARAALGASMSLEEVVAFCSVKRMRHGHGAPHPDCSTVCALF